MLYNLLVVDDEEIAVRGIVEGIDWSTLPFGRILTAFDAEEARQAFNEQPIHVLISDIDMPMENGIRLLEWVNANSPATKTIFLTGHADFRFAQQAVQLDSFDYLLKPIDHDDLKSCVERALSAVREREREDAAHRTYAYYYDQWNRQLPLLVERMWQDMLLARTPASVRELEAMFRLYGLPLDAGKQVLPVLVSVEEWKVEWSAQDEEIMTYAIKNAASELLLGARPGHVVQDRNGLIFALLYDPDAADAPDTAAYEGQDSASPADGGYNERGTDERGTDLRETDVRGRTGTPAAHAADRAAGFSGGGFPSGRSPDESGRADRPAESGSSGDAGGAEVAGLPLADRAEAFIRMSGQYLYAVVSCYIGEAVHVADLRQAARQLAELERANVGRTGGVFRISDSKLPKKCGVPKPNLKEWSLLAEAGKHAELEARINELFQLLQDDQPDHAFLVQYYFGAVNVVFRLLQRRGLAPDELYPGEEWRDGEQTIKSLAFLKSWSLQWFGRASAYFGSREKEASATMNKVKRFMEGRLHAEMNREAIAGHVHLNPAYLSRLFRKETGLSLTEYMVELRMNRAKFALAETDAKISDIALEVGYNNFSHFSKLFKKATGLAPQEFRRTAGKPD